jgi:rSAM/selenodomain-associated transferase 2
MKISIVIPTLNEAANLPQTLAGLTPNQDIEIIIADGGSEDDTCAIAQRLGAKTMQTAPGRSRQMNQAANQATGEILLFLHADTKLPAGWQSWVEQTLNNPLVIAGAFELAIDSPQRSLRWVEWGVKVRSRLFQLPYGDQAIFLRAATFRSLGGFPDLGIMEDFVLVRRLQRLGKIAIVPVAVQTAARRWEQVGVVQTTLINQAMILGFYLGISPQRLRRWYRGRQSG